MSSFGDGDNRTAIEDELSWIAKTCYEDFYENKETQRQFLLDVMEVLRYMCNE